MISDLTLFPVRMAITGVDVGRYVARVMTENAFNFSVEDEDVGLYKGAHHLDFYSSGTPGEASRVVVYRSDDSVITEHQLFM